MCICLRRSVLSGWSGPFVLLQAFAIEQQSLFEVRVNFLFSFHDIQAIVHVVAVQSLNCVQLFVTLWTVAQQAPLSCTISRRLLKFMSIESMMLSNHFILCCPVLLCFQSFPASVSFPVSQLFASDGQSVGVSNDYSGLIYFRIIVLISLQSKGLSSLLQNHNLKAKKHNLESRMSGEISITSDMKMTPPLWQKVKSN